MSADWQALSIGPVRVLQQLLSRQGDRVKVSFTIEFYKRIEYLHRRITRVTYAGWTAAGNLKGDYD